MLSGIVTILTTKWGVGLRQVGLECFVTVKPSITSLTRHS